MPKCNRSLPAPPEWKPPSEPDHITVSLKTITPMFGGGYAAREVDPECVIRPAVIRGSLRFWWRATIGAQFQSADALYSAEERLWGGAAHEGEQNGKKVTVGVGTVSLHVSQIAGFHMDDEEIDLQRTRGAYALWPARSQKEPPVAPGQRWKEGVTFDLKIVCPKVDKAVMEMAVRAWILFGGVGGRTRRGLGSLAVVKEPEMWLPADLTPGSIDSLLHADIEKYNGSPATDTPSLVGAGIAAGIPSNSALEAWSTALSWLRDFRQGTDGMDGNRARQPGGRRPSISNWPEADKVRHLDYQLPLPLAHRPRHNATPCWPRAGFGLPIVGQFQRLSREPDPRDPRRTLPWDRCVPPKSEPKGFEIHWRNERGAHDRLASPLIVKAMPKANGTYVPVAIWLRRSYPDGQPALKGVPNSEAPFDLLTAPGDAALFMPLNGHATLCQAFIAWLVDTGRAKEVLL